jgi:hypothetical protein
MKNKSVTQFANAMIDWRVGDEAGARRIAELLITAPETPPYWRSLACQLDRRLDSGRKPVEPRAPATKKS